MEAQAIGLKGRFLASKAVELVRKAVGDPEGKCYVACEAIKYICLEPLSPHYVPSETPFDQNHWFLKTEDGKIIDPTVHQFTFVPDYSKGKGCGFQTTLPSRRAQEILRAIAKANQ